MLVVYELLTAKTLGGKKLFFLLRSDFIKRFTMNQAASHQMYVPKGNLNSCKAIFDISNLQKPYSFALYLQSSFVPTLNASHNPQDLLSPDKEKFTYSTV